MAYQPRPIETSTVTLPEGLLRLAERLAENVHEVWARQRLADGWRLGPRRDDAAREHPNLVPYDQLPDAEREYDRSVTLETLKTLLALGCRIEAPGTGVTGSAAVPVPSDWASVALLERIRDGAADLARLLPLWQERDPEIWSRAPELYRSLAERLLGWGASMLANEVAAEGLEYWPKDLRLRQLQGCALVRSGATERALRILAELEQAGYADEETLGLLARARKDLGLLSADPSERRRHLFIAYQTYARAYGHYKGLWTGINAATLALLLGEKEQAQKLARSVRSRCLAERERQKQDGGDPYWPLATLGEAALLLDEWSEAEEWYRQAAVVGQTRMGDLNTTRRQARILLAHLGRERDRLDRILRIPCVIVFAGHMVDRPGRKYPRFPARLVPAVSQAIRDRLVKLDGRVGYSSAACGSDILFLESVLQLKGETHVVLPYDREQFARHSVNIIDGADWGDRYTKVLAGAAQVIQASTEKMEWGSVSYDYANLVLHGLASVRTEELETDLVPLAVWDGKKGDGPGGTATVVKRWRELGLQVELIDLSEILRRECPEIATQAADADSELDDDPVLILPTEDVRVMTMLFADAVNFSKLTEEQVPKFVKYFLGAIADLLKRSPNASVVRNTWGDGLYFVFETVRDAGLFALDLCDLVTSTRWADRGLPPTLSLRIALHAGPVYRCEDPITKQLNYTGTHVSRAARIEPITPPGQVYASQAFAALASAQRVTDFVCEYVKHAAFAKGHGTFPTYLLRRRP
jgi:class 3 adenylate cyclase